MKEVIKGLALTVLLAVVSACSNGTIPNSQSSENQNFGVLSNNDNSPMSEMDGMEGMPGGKMRGFFKELNLTADQKTQFEALKVAQKDHFKSQKTNMDSLKTTLKDAWLSASIDKVALKTKLDSLKPNEDEQAGFMSDNIINAYNILNVAQRTQVETKLNDMQTKMSQFKNSSIGKDFAGNKDKRFTWFTKDLSLTDAQSTSLKALFDQSEPNKQEMFDKAKKVKDDVLAELKTGTPNSDKIKAILIAAKSNMDSKMSERFDKFVQAHDLLTLEQRQKVADRFEKMHNGFGKKGHHKHNKFPV